MKRNMLNTPRAVPPIALAPSLFYPEAQIYQHHSGAGGWRVSWRVQKQQGSRWRARGSYHEDVVGDVRIHERRRSLREK
jgi:hypothetical protein